MKRIINQFIYLFFISFFIFTSCVNEIDSTSKQTYISIGSVVITDEINEASRTIVANNTAELTDFVLKGTPSGGSEEQLASAENTTKLSAARIPVTAGVWDFTLSAKLGEINFTGTASAEITADNTTDNPKPISFVLSSNVGYGGLNITMTFTGAANKVAVTLKNELQTITNHTQDFTTFTSSGSNTRKFTYSRDVTKTDEQLASGTYFLNFDFYKIKDSEEFKLNTSRNLIRIANGITTEASLSVSLNDAYEITYKFYVDGSEITDTTGISPVEGVLTSLYAKKTPTFSLPEMSKAGYTFDAWYKDTDFTEENKITQITQGSTGDLELYANFVAQGGGGNSSGTPDGLAYVDLGLPSGTLWANMNVGATSVTDIGTQYEWMDGGVNLTQLSADDTMPSENDMATINFGTDWCMPTKEQFEELYNCCYFEPVTSYNGNNVSGYIVFKAKDETHAGILTGCGLYNIVAYKKDGYDINTDPHIFIPAESDDVYLWSSTYYGDSYDGRDQSAYCFFFVDQYEPIETEIIKTTTTDEWEKHPVRPVYVGFETIVGGTFSTDNHVGTVENDNDYNAGTLTIPNLEVCSHLVTQYEYEQLMTYYGVVKSNSSLTPTENSESAKKSTPAYFVTWLDAIVYCNLRSKAEGLTPVYSLSGNNEITEADSPWTDWGHIAVDGNGKYYYNQTDLENHEETSSYDTDGGSFSYDLSANGYRLPTTAEYQNIMSENLNLFSGGYDEWCQNYNYSGYRHCYFDGTNKIPKQDDEIYSDYRANNMGFRVVRNAGANGGSNP